MSVRWNKVLQGAGTNSFSILKFNCSSNLSIIGEKFPLGLQESRFRSNRIGKGLGAKIFSLKVVNKVIRVIAFIQAPIKKHFGGISRSILVYFQF